MFKNLSLQTQQIGAVDMAELKDLVELMKLQMTLQREMNDAQQKRHEEEMKMKEAELKQKQVDMEQQLTVLRDALRSTTQTAPTSVSVSSIPSFTAFDSNQELWQDYFARFQTFVSANSVSEDRVPQVFLTNQSPLLYKELSTMAAQQTPSKKINELSMNDIKAYMDEQYDPKLFIVRERFKFWNDMQRKPGESLQELASRIRQDAVTCDFASIKDPQDEALRQRFICSVNNEAVLKALFKRKEEELTFAKAGQVAI